MVSTRPRTSKSSSPFNSSLVPVLYTQITIGIIVTFMFHSFFQFSCKVEVLTLFSLFFSLLLLLLLIIIIIIIIIIINILVFSCLFTHVLARGHRLAAIQNPG